MRKKVYIFTCFLYPRALNARARIFRFLNMAHVKICADSVSIYALIPILREICAHILVFRSLILIPH